MSARSEVSTAKAVRKIALDCMGGDFAPRVVLEAAARISQKTAIELLLVGDRAQIEPALERLSANAAQIEILHASDAVQMNDTAWQAARRLQSSVALAAAAVAEGRAEALVSAGNTAGTLVHAARVIPRIAGIERPALAAVYPTRPRPHNPDPFALLLDVGANLNCAPEDLLAFATMGAAYASRISKVSRPTVGLLNIGEEPGKGDDLLRKAYALLAEAPGFQFHGNIEGRDVPRGVVDVIVCPGVLGNVTLKLLESMGDVVLSLGEEVFKRKASWRLGRWLLRGGIARLANLVDYSSYGGAPILGFERIVIKAHGRSNARAIENAVKVAAKAVREDVCGAIAAGVREAQRSKMQTDPPSAGPR